MEFRKIKLQNSPNLSSLLAFVIDFCLPWYLMEGFQFFDDFIQR